MSKDTRDEKLTLYEQVRKGGEAAEVRRWLDEFRFGEVLQVFQNLVTCGPEHLKLLEVQAEAKILGKMISETDEQIILAEGAKSKLADMSKKGSY